MVVAEEQGGQARQQAESAADEAEGGGQNALYNVYISLFAHAVPEGVLRWIMTRPKWRLAASAPPPAGIYVIMFV